MIYLIVFTYLFILSISFDFLKVKGPKKFFYYLSMIILILIAGFRWKVGGDTLTYQSKFDDYIYPIYEFNKINFLKINWEPGIVILMSLSKTIVSEFWFFQLIHAIFVNVIFFKFFKKYSYFKFTSVLLYSFFLYFYFNMEIMREILSICIFINFMYPLLEQKKYKKYYFINLFLLLIHTSSLILFFFPLLCQLKEINKKNIVLFLLLGVLLYMSLNQFGSILFSFDTFGDFSNKVDGYSKYSFNIVGIIYNALAFLIFPFLLIKFSERYYNHSVFNNLYFVYFFIIFLYIFYSGFGRFINYLSPFMLVYFSNVVYLLWKLKKFNKVRSVLIIIILFLPIFHKSRYYLTDTSMYAKDTRKYYLWFPYSSIFNKEDYFKDRFKIYSGNMNDLYYNNNNSKK
ncbi:EpsG family protein [Chryseobacterium sp. POE27]|uniref:EpsG family protein n=1 Tax=Chryseobacterium sp. POE27 TaxID=3138177 RepID=UPI003219359E